MIILVVNIPWLTAGEFGVVYKAFLKQGATDEVVAVKSIKGMQYSNYKGECITITNI